jgi:hypothetical protein
MLTNVAVLLALAVPAPIAAPTVEPPAEAVIDILHFSGSGCPGDKTSVIHTPDQHAAALIYSEYEVFVGADRGPSPASRSCTAVVRVTPPAGYTSAVDLIDQRGYASLPPGATGDVRVSYQSANSSPVRADETLPTPFEDGWQTTHRVPADQQVYGPCGQPHFLVVNTELRVTAPDGVNADASVFSTDFSTNHLIWKRC